MPLTPQPGDVPNSYELHLNLGAIKGESQSATHSEEIEIDSFTWGGTSAALRSASGGVKGGKTTVSEIVVTKQLDKSTPAIFNAMVSNSVIKQAILSMSKSTGGKKPEDYVTITLTNVVVVSVEAMASRYLPEAQRGSETVKLSYQRITIDYKMQIASGLLTLAGSVTYDATLGT